ncbi:acetyltransferase [Pseudomonas sp. Pc102]|uniref:NeuD/PglB/VioB family sugar acetyltransferase n=1 Tax=Pseudomonas sp. Pc102 TaxID=2678261 RepID=UPI001BCD481B|nr:NeuD/PglB/VioB family sugar acetyltransferase [Pseudomonas sp. Pc102]BBP86046.1 acetyltransferase [Pseudomonas sp. Pc102]
MRRKKLVILGFGGHARSVADVALCAGYDELLFVDSNVRPEENFLGHPTQVSTENIDWSQWDVIPAAGDNLRRSQQFRDMEELGVIPVSLVSPHATLGAGSSLSVGCLVGHHAHIGPMTIIGCGCIINTAAVIEHESIVGNFSHISVHATIAGRSRLGEFSMLGAGATIIDGISVTAGVTVGAGGVVNRPISSPGTYVGVPVRKIEEASK